MVTRYAESTEVPTDRSIAELRSVVIRAGGTAFATAEGQGKFAVQFAMKDRVIKFVVPLPDINAKKFERDGRGSIRTKERRYAAWEQVCRAIFRSLVMSVRMKLEAVEVGIESFEEAFYAHILLPNGRTIYEATHEAVSGAYLNGKMPLALTAGIGDSR